MSSKILLAFLKTNIPETNIDKRIPDIKKIGEVSYLLSKNRPPAANITSGMTIIYPNSQAKLRVFRKIALSFLSFSLFWFTTME